MVQTALFFLFSGMLIGSATMVIAGRNPVHSVLFLILAFLNASGLFLLAGAEFLAMILVVVYVGAVAVLFLFVVMMLDVNFKELRVGMVRYKLVGSLVGLLFAGELVTVGVLFQSASTAEKALAQPMAATLTNSHALGRILYTDYFYLFQLSGVILLVAMIGAIVLTLRTREKVRRQDYPAQLSRSPTNSLELVKVLSGQGIQRK
jgi:NADH-quinone oxidoreductase subunit J